MLPITKWRNCCTRNWWTLLIGMQHQVINLKTLRKEKLLQLSSLVLNPGHGENRSTAITCFWATASVSPSLGLPPESSKKDKISSEAFHASARPRRSTLEGVSRGLKLWPWMASSAPVFRIGWMASLHHVWGSVSGWPLLAFHWRPPLA